MYMSERSSDVVKKMAELVKAGATLLAYSCPVCGTPLLRLKSGEVYCVRCGKRVFIVKSDLEERSVLTSAVLEELRDTITNLLSDLVRSLREGKFSPGERIEVGREVLVWLEALERVNRLLREVSSSGSS